MLEEKSILPFNFFKYGGVYTGEHAGMRYKIQKTGDKPDYVLEAQLWQGPFASDSVPAEQKSVKEFEYSEEGRMEAIGWLLQQYDARREEWDHALLPNVTQK